MFGRTEKKIEPYFTARVKKKFIQGHEPLGSPHPSTRALWQSTGVLVVEYSPEPPQEL